MGSGFRLCGAGSAGICSALGSCGGYGDSTRTAGTTTIVAAVTRNTTETDEDNGSFFDLEFAVPDEDDDAEGGDETQNKDNDRTDSNLSLSPSDELFFKGRLMPIEPYSLVFNPSKQPQLYTVSLLKFATKFPVSMLGLKKSKTTANATGQKTDPSGFVSSIAPKPQEEEMQQKQEQLRSKPFTVKFKVEEVPIVSLFTGDTQRQEKEAGEKMREKENKK
ncbi:probable membrane-associated kinase regulator 2 [Alnus glutinosa]|uniref:probable membrane-associated kinase regulator 2 n=1 Tax=Alnus glutinosa TaxID=3517 RepID=UPI002D7967BB|nr:probable membrane-associated kinase regulator 2 [Alnus glutinosa]